MVSDHLKSLRCPLCGQLQNVMSEEDCQQHISSCQAFHAQYAPGAPRAGLVTGFDAVTTPPSAPAPLPQLPTYEDACQQFATALHPLLCVAAAEQTGGRVDEASELVSSLAGALASAAGDLTFGVDASASDSFGIEELVTVTLGPYLTPLGVTRGKHVLSDVTTALDVLRQTASPKSTQFSLGERLRAEWSRRGAALPSGCTAGCGASGGAATKLRLCSRCKMARYCSVECQRRHWPTHKLACRPAQ